ncbi:MAG: site-2 protease family protein [Clostridia bacterium]|nr:site-2 protease family protein [Clostridia bacterium]
MSTFINVLQIILAILLFGFLIFIHEGGHFLFARLFKVTVNEFAIGMGPKIFSKKSKKSGITYSFRAFPIGGFVSMAGEDEESDDPNAFNKKPVWQRLIITVAGAATNIIVGGLVMAILVCSAPNSLGGTTVAKFMDDAVSQEAGLQVGDRIVEVDGHNVHIADELMYTIMRLGIEPVDLTVIRDDEKLVLEDVEFPPMSSEGIAFGSNDFLVYAEEPTLANLAKHSFFKTTYTVKMIWESLYDLVTGRFGVEAVSGPVGVTEALTEAADTGVYSFTYLAVVISINLGVMNLLPFPALDGGRILFLLIEAIRRKPLKMEVEAYINFAGLVLLMILMVLICIKDVIGLF